MAATLAQLEKQAAEQNAAAQPEPPAAEPAAPEPAPPEGETPPAEPKQVLPNRINTAQFSDTEQQAIALGKALKDAGEPVPSLKERIEIIEARLKPSAAAASEPEPTVVLGELDAKLAAAVAKKKELAKSLGTEELDAAQDEIEAIRQEKAAIENRQAQAASVKEAAFSKARTLSIERAKGQFPTSTDPDSDLGQAIAAHITRINADPERSVLLKDPKAPETIAAEAAMQLAALRAADKGTSVAQELAALMEPDAPAKAAAPAPAPAPTVRKPTPAGGASSIPPATPPPPKVLTLAEAAGMTADQLEKAFPSPKQSTGYVLRR